MRLDANTNAYPDSDSHADSHTNADPDPDTHSNTDSYAHSNTDAYANPDTNAFCRHRSRLAGLHRHGRHRRSGHHHGDSNLDRRQ